MRTRFLLVMIVFLLVGCTNSNNDAPTSTLDQPTLTSTKFPDTPGIDRAVYERIQKTCKKCWQLENMKMDTFKVRPDRDEYIVECDGIVDAELYHCVIRVNSAGEWINDGRSKKSP